jgi:hypothetical protein
MALLARQPFRQLHQTAARLYRDAFAREPRFALAHRYNAACCAALAGCRQGKDAAALSAAQRLRWRRQALTWLRGDLAAHGKHLKEGPPTQAAQARQALEHWKRDPDLSGVREKEALGKLPEEEQAAWRKLWADLDTLLGPTPAPR